MYRSYLIVGLLISLGFLASSCQDKPKDGRTDTYSSGVVKIASDESFSPIITEEIGIFESDYPQAHIVPIFTDEVNAINLLLKYSIVLTLAAFAMIGLLRARVTKIKKRKAIFESLGLGIAAAVISYGAGNLLERIIS